MIQSCYLRILKWSKELKSKLLISNNWFLTNLGKKPNSSKWLNSIRKSKLKSRTDWTPKKILKLELKRILTKMRQQSSLRLRRFLIKITYQNAIVQINRTLMIWTIQTIKSLNAKILRHYKRTQTAVCLKLLCLRMKKSLQLDLHRSFLFLKLISIIFQIFLSQ